MTVDDKKKEDTYRPVTDLMRYKEGIRGREQLAQLGGRDDDVKKRRAGFSKRCPIRDEKSICMKSREVGRGPESRIIPFYCTATTGFETCPIYMKWCRE